MSKKLKGGCLCGAVKFEIEARFDAFYQCHCRQCQQLTGTAFASNLFTEPGNITWIAGLENVSRYVHPDRDFSQSFCKVCGSGLPFVNKDKTALLVPAGSLDSMPNIDPVANIFVSEKASWLEPGAKARSYQLFPE